MTRFRFASTPRPGQYTVEVDDHDVSNAVTGIRLGALPHEIPRIQLDVAAFELDTDLDSARVYLPDHTKELLTRLGWTPPPGEQEAP